MTLSFHQIDSGQAMTNAFTRLQPFFKYHVFSVSSTALLILVHVILLLCHRTLSKTPTHKHMHINAYHD